MTCEACGEPIGVRWPMHPTLCQECAATIDEAADLLLDYEFYYDALGYDGRDN